MAPRCVRARGRVGRGPRKTRPPREQPGRRDGKLPKDTHSPSRTNHWVVYEKQMPAGVGRGDGVEMSFLPPPQPWSEADRARLQRRP